MKQILQSLKTGDTEVSDVPCPSMKRGQLLIRSSQSVVSAGTERMLVEFGKANLIKKARQQPDKVRMVLDKVNSDGLMPTIDAVRSKLDQPLPLGYCNAGVVLDSDVNEFKVVIESFQMVIMQRLLEWQRTYVPKFQMKLMMKLPLLQYWCNRFTRYSLNKANIR